MTSETKPGIRNSRSGIGPGSGFETTGSGSWDGHVDRALADSVRLAYQCRDVDIVVLRSGFALLVAEPAVGAGVRFGGGVFDFVAEFLLGPFGLAAGVVAVEED